MVGGPADKPRVAEGHYGRAVVVRGLSGRAEKWLRGVPAGTEVVGALQQNRKCSRGPSKGPEVVGGPPAGPEAVGGPSARAGSVRGAIRQGWKWSGCPPAGTEVVGGPTAGSEVVRVPSGRAGSGRGLFGRDKSG